MSVARHTYVTREEVKEALDVAETARADARIDRAIEAASDDVDGYLRRKFSPTLATRYFAWPHDSYRTPWRLWLDGSEVISVTTLTSGGIEIPEVDYFLEPANSGPPYTSIEVDTSSASAFASGSTRQRAVAAIGLFGYRDDEELVGTLAGSLNDDPDATASVVWNTPRVGTGSLLRIGDERVLVTNRTMVTSGQALQTPLTKDMSAVTVAVSDGSAFGADEILLVDGERMRVIDVAGNTLVVKRAVDGSVLAAHAGSAIYALTGVTLRRAANGSTLAGHDAAAPIYRHLSPPLIRDLALAYALTQHLQESAGYARVVGAGENQQEVSGRGLRSIQESAMAAHGRQLLQGAV